MITTVEPTPRPARACYENGMIVLELRDGRSVSFPVKGNVRLESGTPDQLNRIRISPFGLHWPDLDEDLSIEGILRGNWGQHTGR